MLDQEDLPRIANQQMPFGKYAGTRLIDLPEEYLLWFVDRGFPSGRLGELMQMTLEIKINGLEKLIDPLKESSGEAQKEPRQYRFNPPEDDLFRE